MVTSQPVKVMALGLPGEGILLQGLALPPVVLVLVGGAPSPQGGGEGGGPQGVSSPQARSYPGPTQCWSGGVRPLSSPIPAAPSSPH